MKNVLKLVAIAVVGLFVLAGCRTASVYNVMDSPSGLEAKVSDAKMYKAIKAAGFGLGWQITKVKPGLAQGQLSLRGLQAVVEISYTEKTYSIKYKNSVGLKYNSENNTIHKNYNGWIQNLNNAISLHLNNLSE